MESVKISQSIVKRIDLLESARKKNSEFAINMAKSNAEYSKILAKTIIQLKNGVEMRVEGETISSPPVTIIEKIAKGVCWEEQLTMDKNVAFYKNSIRAIDSMKAELNALQSLFKYQTEL